MKRRATVIVGLLLVLGSFPGTSAEHLSAGAEDTVAIEADERPDPDGSGPQEAIRSVPGTTQATRDHPYGLGTMPAEDCYTPDGEVEVEDAGKLQQAHGFCNMLVYHEDSDGPNGLRTVSPPDQTLFDPITRFDVIRTHTYAGGLSNCLPFCPDGEGQPAGGQLAFDAFHEAGSVVGLTDTPSDANDEAPSDRDQTYAVTLHAASPRGVIQETVGLWEMDGWWWPTALSTFVAYVEDGPGDPLTQEDLDTIVGQMNSTGELHGSTEASICGYVPDFLFTTVGPGASGLNCEFGFEYEPATGGPDASFDEGYRDECEAEAYVCNSVNGPAWTSGNCLCIGLTDPEPPGADPLPALDPPYSDGSPLAGPEGQTDYIRWHFVIAPHNSRCGGAQEPGFSFDADGADKPFLAHDVDVYTAITDLSAGSVGGKTAEAMDYADAVVEPHTTTAVEALGDPTTLVPDLPVPAEASNVAKEDTLEPNNADPIGSIDDTSRSAENGVLDTGPLERGIDSPCEKLFAQETTDTLDDWVDYIDADANAVQDVDQGLGPLTLDRYTERVTQRIGLYANADGNQDDSNRPGPSLYSTTGKVGFFADADDDGEYDQLTGGTKYNARNILADGAYPMTWNMHLDENRNVDADSSCGEDPSMAEAMIQLGYGKNTGLVQAIYLQEPTAFADIQTDRVEVAPFPGGNNIYLLMSQGARVLYDENPATTANALDEEVDTLVSELSSYADANNGDLPAPGVEIPARELGLDAAFDNQCNGPTGNFDSNVDFLHSCQVDCSGDTIATMYTFEITGDGTLQGSQLLPTFSPSDTPYDFGAFQHTWYDVDPFDNNPDRNDDQQDTPPDPNRGFLGEGFS